MDSKKWTGTGTRRPGSEQKRRPAEGNDERRPYFAPEGLRFLRGLARNNDRDWFNARKPVYEAEIKRPMLAVIEAVTGAMMDFAPGHVRAPESIMMRIYRDTRFSNNKLPYKPHVSAWWVHDGLRKTSGAGFYLQISGKRVEIAAGAFMPETEQLLAIRRFLMEHHQEYRKLAQARGLRRLLKDEVRGESLSRSPKSFPAEHPAADLYRQKRWGFSASVAAETATQPDFAKAVASYFRAAAPLVSMLNRPLLLAAERPRKPLF
jgi:uncharacterized protein (TIGR02453 family)